MNRMDGYREDPSLHAAQSTETKPIYAARLNAELIDRFNSLSPTSAVVHDKAPFSLYVVCAR